MEEDIQNYSPTVMFRGTPCIYFACLSARLYPINFKTAEPIRPKETHPKLVSF